MSQISVRTDAIVRRDEHTRKFPYMYILLCGISAAMYSYSRPDPLLRVLDSSVPDERVRVSDAGVAAGACVVCGGGIVVTAPGPVAPVGVVDVAEAGVGVTDPVGLALRVGSVPRVEPVVRRLSAFDGEPGAAAAPGGFFTNTGWLFDPAATPIWIGVYGSHHVGCEYGFCQPYGS